ncbi:MAG: NUDIX hydrolase, partial [Ruminiclostridium sp.]|nr:NUDIX hydrolase [Ruminiclostridium sp.]
HLQDDQWPLDYIDHDRPIARAIVVDDEHHFYFMRVERWDEFAEGALIETSGGGVEPGEDLNTAILRELKEELGVTAEILGKIGVVTDYYNLIHRRNINHYFLCRALSFGEKNMTQEEREVFHLSTLKVTYEEALKEYETCAATKLGKLLAAREVPVLRQAKAMLEEVSP